MEQILANPFRFSHKEVMNELKFLFQEDKEIYSLVAEDMIGIAYLLQIYHNIDKTNDKTKGVLLELKIEIERKVLNVRDILYNKPGFKNN